MLFLKILVSILVMYLFTQLSAEQRSTKIWQYFRIVVETAIWGFLLQSWSEAKIAIISPFSLSKIVGILYVMACLGMLGILLADLVQLNKTSPQLVALDLGVQDRNTRVALSQADWKKNRKILMGKVQAKWMEGVLQKSLHQNVQMVLGWEEMPEMAGLEWQEKEQPTKALPPGTRLLDQFEKLEPGRTLLVLGAAGAGKTTVLLELAQDLLHRTQATDLTAPIPIVLNLSSWGTQGLPERKTQTFTAWLKEELWLQYQIRRDVSLAGLAQQQWILLLDGLDELAPKDRDTCVEAFMQFRQKFKNIDVVLCCRAVAYEALNTPLHECQAVVHIQPLSEVQVHRYFNEGGEALAGLLSAWQKDADLQKLTRVPLFLGILTLAYQNHSAEELVNIPENQRLKVLFDRYIQKRFIQGSISQSKQQQMLQWLGKIAQKMGPEKEFLIERMQSNAWLVTERNHWIYRLSVGLMVGLIGGLIIKPIGWLILIFLYWGVLGSLGVMFYGMIFLMMAFIGGEFLQWLLIGFFAVLCLGLTVWLFSKYFVRLKRSSNASILREIYPNQEIWYLFKSMLIKCVKYFFYLTIISLLILIAFSPLLENLAMRSVVEITIGLVFMLLALQAGGLICIQHFALRLVLALTQQVPLDLVMLFKQAEDRLFIYRTGGSYVFVHRYLQEHFANLSFDET